MDVRVRQVDWESHKADLLMVRHAVFVEEQGVPIELEHDEEDARSLHLMVTDAEDTAIATARMLPGGYIGRMAVLASWRDNGIGTAMLRELLRIAAARGIPSLRLNAQCEAESFYRRLGFKPEGEVFEEAGIDHRHMILHLHPDGR